MCHEFFSALEVKWRIKGSSCLHAADCLVRRESRDKFINILVSILSLLHFTQERAVYTSCLYFHFLFRLEFFPLLPAHLLSSTTLKQLRPRSPPRELLYLYISMALLSPLSVKLCSNRHFLKFPIALLFFSLSGQHNLSDYFFSGSFSSASPLKWQHFWSSALGLSHSICSPWTTASHAHGIHCQWCLLRKLKV